jgi:hypothetical protein
LKACAAKLGPPSVMSRRSLDFISWIILGSNLRSMRVLALDAVFSNVENTIVSAACHIFDVTVEGHNRRENLLGHGVRLSENRSLVHRNSQIERINLPFIESLPDAVGGH